MLHSFRADILPWYLVGRLWPQVFCRVWHSVLVNFSIAVTKWPTVTWGQKGLFQLLDCGLFLKAVKSWSRVPGAGTESENTEECSFLACFSLALSASIFIYPRPFCSEIVSPTVGWALLHWLSVKKMTLPSDGNSSSDCLFPVSRSESGDRNCDRCRCR